MGRLDINLFFAIFRVCLTFSLHECRFTQLQLFFPLHGVSWLRCNTCIEGLVWSYTFQVILEFYIEVFFFSREIEEFGIVGVWWNFRHGSSRCIAMLHKLVFPTDIIPRKLIFSSELPSRRKKHLAEISRESS